MLYDNSVTKCRLSGNLCSAVCTRVSKICEYKKIEGRFITLGQLYFLYKINQTNKLEDRDFIVRIISGKPYISDDSRHSLLYDPIYLLENRILPSQISKSLSMNDKEIHRSVLIICDQLFGKERKKRLEIVENAISMHDDEPPQHILNIKEELQRPITEPNFYTFHEYVNIVFNYVINKVSLTKNEIRIILVYLLVSYVPKNNDDFPTNILRIDEDRISNIIEKTRILPDNNPTKWTKKRYEKLKEQKDTYRRLVLFDNHLYLWKTYTLPEIKIEDISEYEIRAKCLLDLIINKFSFVYNSLYVILNKQEESLNLAKIRQVISLIFDIVEEKEEFTIKNRTQYFTDEMLKRQYILTEDVSYGESIVALAKKMEVAQPSLVDLFKYLEEEKKIEEFKFI